MYYAQIEGCPKHDQHVGKICVECVADEISAERANRDAAIAEAVKPWREALEPLVRACENMPIPYAMDRYQERLNKQFERALSEAKELLHPVPEQAGEQKGKDQ